jgi:hypothetical protein
MLRVGNDIGQTPTTLEVCEVLPSHTIHPDQLPDGAFPRVLKVVQYMRDKLDETGWDACPCGPFDDPKDPITASLCDAFFCGYLRLFVGHDPATGEQRILARPRD